MYGVRLGPHNARAPLSVALTLLVVLVSLIGSSISQGAFPGANGKIVFVSSRDGNTEIYAMNADGTGETRLTSNPASDQAPTWSPDGTKIAFMTNRDDSAYGTYEIYTMNADGSNQTRLTNNPTNNLVYDQFPAWSPDGTKIAFMSRRNLSCWDCSSIVTINADGTGETVVTNEGADPAWSPDGTKIAVDSCREEGCHETSRNWEIYTMNADGSDQTRLTNNTTLDLDPVWSPDGTRIAFETTRDSSSKEVYSMKADGSSQTRLTNNTTFDGDPAWSPDGAKIAFWTDRDGTAEIYSMNADGTNQTRITTNTVPDGFPDWQPVAGPGGYPRPNAASPLSVSLVPAYSQCTAGDRTHGPPLAYPSCHPPALQSGQLTVGTVDANGETANARGFAKYTAIVGAPGGADDADVRFAFQLTDVRRQDTLADYTGELGVASIVRITDRLGGPATEAGTVVDFEHKLTVTCAATGGTVGATCATSTTFDALVPGTIKEGKRAVWQLGQVRVNDGGPDGLASTTPNTLFAVQGVFVP